MKRLQAQNDKARQIKPLYAELAELDKAEEQALIDSGEYRRPTLYDVTIGSVSRGRNNSLKGRELYKAMQGQDNEAEKYQEILEGEQYKFIPGSLLGKAVSGGAELLGQQIAQLTDPGSVAMGLTGAGMASIAGKAGPQILLPEEVVTVPAAFMTGLSMGAAKNNMEVEAGLAYEELLGNGISPETAKRWPPRWAA